MTDKAPSPFPLQGGEYLEWKSNEFPPLNGGMKGGVPFYYL